MAQPNTADRIRTIYEEAIQRDREVQMPRAREIVAEMIAEAEVAARSRKTSVHKTFSPGISNTVFTLVCEALKAEGFRIISCCYDDPNKYIVLQIGW